jgi:hypothetical protein
MANGILTKKVVTYNWMLQYKIDGEWGLKRPMITFNRFVADIW